MHYRVFEQRVLDVLFTTTVPLTPAHMAYYARIPVAEAEEHLDRMVNGAILVKECDMETGRMSYVYPQRTLLAGAPSRALAPLPPRPLYSAGVAAALSIILPGSGHLYSGRERAGLLWMFGTLAGYLCLIIPGIILHCLCVASAANVPRA
jgi:hypothetical protein